MVAGLLLNARRMGVVGEAGLIVSIIHCIRRSVSHDPENWNGLD